MVKHIYLYPLPPARLSSSLAFPLNVGGGHVALRQNIYKIAMTYFGSLLPSILTKSVQTFTALSLYVTEHTKTQFVHIFASVLSISLSKSHLNKCNKILKLCMPKCFTNFSQQYFPVRDEQPALGFSFINCLLSQNDDQNTHIYTVNANRLHCPSKILLLVFKLNQLIYK